MSFYMHWGITKFMSHCVLHAVGQYQSDELLLQDPEVLLFHRALHVHIEVTNRFCGSPRVYNGSIVKCTRLSVIISNLRNLSE